MTAKGWLEVDKEGLRQLIDHRGRGFALCELVQNAWDEETTRVDILISFGGSIGRGRARVEVIDDSPNGFQDIRDAFTMFAPSRKKGDPEKRGRFNLGEKLVLALCKDAEIVSVNSAVVFDESGRRASKKRTKQGTIFRGTMAMSRRDINDAVAMLRTLIPPKGITTAVTTHDLDETGSPWFFIPDRKPLARFTTSLPTVIEDGGALRQTRRKTIVEVHDPIGGEVPTLYEMGIPVVELDGGDKWHVNVRQKVPLNTDRDNVRPSYLRELRVAVLNECHQWIDDDEATNVWVTEASEDPACAPAAIERVLDARYGRKRVSYDPSDPEANMLATSKGFTVVHGRSLTAGQWENARAASALLPAGKVTPSPKVERRPGGIPPVKTNEWTPTMRRMARYAAALCHTLDVARLTRIDWFDAPGLGFAAAWEKHGNSRAVLMLNFAALRDEIVGFDDGDTSRFDALLLHEFAHQRESNHLSERYHDELCRLAAECLKIPAPEVPSP